jgi:hypothetical protein
MRTHTIATTLALAVILHSPGAAADGNTLLRDCQSTVELYDSDGASGNALNSQYCLGSINAVGSLSVLLNGAISKEKQFCLPGNTTNIQIARIVVKYINDHPNEMHYPEGYLVIGAFQDAFPCK